MLLLVQFLASTRQVFHFLSSDLVDSGQFGRQWMLDVNIHMHAPNCPCFIPAVTVTIAAQTLSALPVISLSTSFVIEFHNQFNGLHNAKCRDTVVVGV